MPKTAGKDIMKWKKRCFAVVMLVPAVTLAAIVVSSAWDIYMIRHLNYQEIYSALENHLARREAVSFPMPEDLLGGDASKKTVFVFGSSDIILSDGEIFPTLLEERHPGLRIVNFGSSGIDSFSVRQRMREALSLARPDIIILYYGHNDYNTAYNEFILPYYFHRFHALLRIPYLLRDRSRSVGRFVNEPFNYYWFYAINRPKLLKALESAGLLDINSDDFALMNRLILDHFIANNNAIMELTAGIPLLLVTPIGNLQAEPIGDVGHTRANYRKGLAAADYHKSLEYLRAARDSEVFTFDIRAKSALLDYLRAIERTNVYVLDLEKSLEEKQFAFGNDDFVDYVHLNEHTHSLVADIVYDFMVRHGLLRR